MAIRKKRPIGPKWKGGNKAGKNAIAAIEFAKAMEPMFRQLRLELLSAHTAAIVLNAHGIMSYGGRPWSSQTVLRVRKRIDPDYQPGPATKRFRP